MEGLPLVTAASEHRPEEELTPASGDDASAASHWGSWRGWLLAAVLLAAASLGALHLRSPKGTPERLKELARIAAASGSQDSQATDLTPRAPPNRNSV